MWEIERGLPENSSRETMTVELGSAAFVVPAAVAAVVVVDGVVTVADDDDTSIPLAGVTMTAIASSFCPVAVEKRPEIATSQTPASNLRLVAAM